MKTDIQIAQEAIIKPIKDIASKIGIDEDDLEYYGKYKAKLSLDLIDKTKNHKNGKVVLVTALTPTKAGEGKSTTSIGLVDGLASIGTKVLGCLREPSLGPVFGVKGGATGGGHAQVIPMVDINLHFTGDIHAMGAANNLVSALIDNHLYYGNALNIDPTQIIWKRAVDMNDRALREITIGQADKKSVERKDSFAITVASPIMAILCLSKDMNDLKARLERTVFAYNTDGKALTLKDLGGVGSLLVLLKDALKPNLVQTLEGNPIFIHGGPFANIAHGSNSIIATRLARKLADVVVTEAGFGSDLGAQKFMDITSLAGEFEANTVVLVATIRALKLHGGVKYEDLKYKDVESLNKGLENLAQHISIMNHYGAPIVIALNKFVSDTDEEIEAVKAFCEKSGVAFAINESWEKGSKGAEELAQVVLSLLEKDQASKSIFIGKESLEFRIDKIAKELYGAKSIIYSDKAKEQLNHLKHEGYGNLNVCMAKTQSSISDDPKLLGRPQDFDLHIEGFILSSAADFVVVLAGKIMTMPGLSKDPAALHIDILEDGEIVGLF
jgi:formate--tetrahydrofolate ligase